MPGRWVSHQSASSWTRYERIYPLLDSTAPTGGSAFARPVDAERYYWTVGVELSNAAAEAAKARKVEGYLIPLQNTTQQPSLESLTNRAIRQKIFENSWNRTALGDANDTREVIVKIANLRAKRAKLLGYPNFAAWKLENQMAAKPEAAPEKVEAQPAAAKPEPKPAEKNLKPAATPKASTDKKGQ